ncbi:hypothetical protein [Thalassotalea sediminis]|uniref:hypothetical protein n=1 Tax=Thalassotalea sediminis TaxID=1759089 RepID=UPI0025739E24|nr:hypothetical protein [Thalassotalea sediminis]
MEISKVTFRQHTQNTQPASMLKSNNNFAQVLADYQPAISNKDQVTPSNAETYVMNTNQGKQNIVLDDYLTPGPQSSSVNINDIPLLLPTAHNIDTLSKYTQEQFKDLLSQYNISTPPKTIEFDTEGQLVLPADYPYTAQLKHALSENPNVENALRTTAALASHYAGIMEGQPFRDEMSTARSQADRDRIVEKYSYLFDDDRPAKQIILTFLGDGNLLLTEKKQTA